MAEVDINGDEQVELHQPPGEFFRIGIG